MRRSCRMLLALVLIIGILVPALPVMAQDEGPVLESLEVTPANSGVELRFNAMVNSINEEKIIVEAIYDGVAERIYAEIYPHGDSLVQINLHENVLYYSDYRVTIEQDAVFADFIGNKNVYVEEWSIADTLSSVSLELGDGEFDVSTTMSMEFVTDKALSGGLDQIIIAEYGHWEPQQHFYMDSVTDVFITYDGIEYPASYEPGYSIKRVWLPQGLYISPGKTVQLTFHNVLTPEAWQQDSSDIFIRTTQHEAWAGKSIWFFNNDGKNPANVSLKPINENGTEKVAYNYEQTSYELQFETIEDMNGMSITMMMPYGYEVLGFDGMNPYDSVYVEDTKDLVDITVTGAVYHPSYIHVHNDGGFTFNMVVNETISAGETVRVTIDDNVIRTPAVPGDYMIKMRAFDGQGFSILLPVKVEQGQYQPQPPLRIRDLQLQVSNSNSYTSLSDYVPVDVFGNGDRVVYTFTGTAVKESDHARVAFRRAEWIDFWGYDPVVYDAKVRVDGVSIPTEVSLSGDVVIVDFRNSANPNVPFQIQEGQSFDIQLIVRNPEIFGDSSSAIFPIELDMNGSFAKTEVEIQKINPIIGMSEPYAGVQAGQYLFEARDGEGFYAVTLDFPAGTVVPEDISMDDMEISIYGWGNPPQLIGIEVVGSSIKLEFSSYVNELSVTILESAGIPTPSASGSYKYGVTYNGVNHDVTAQLSKVPADPKLLAAELIGYGEFEQVGIAYAIDMIFDGALDASFISRFNQTFEFNLPITVTYPAGDEGQTFSIDACWAEVDLNSANTMRIYANCGMSEDEILRTSTGAVVQIDNAVIRGVGGTYSPGSQSVKLVTSGIVEELAEKLAAFVPEGETLHIGHLLRAMRDPELIALFGDSLNVYTVEMILQQIETKFVE